MNRQQRRHPAFKKVFREEQAKQPKTLTKIPRAGWPETTLQNVVEVWRSQEFLVVIYDDGGFDRMTVNRASIGKSGKWESEITWDELQRLKSEIGRGGQWAVEVYPADGHVVNVANMRHLWLLPSEPAYGWKRKSEKLP